MTTDGSGMSGETSMWLSVADGNMELQHLKHEIGDAFKDLSNLRELVNETETQLIDIEDATMSFYENQVLVTCFVSVKSVLYQVRKQVSMALEEMKKRPSLNIPFPKPSYEFDGKYERGNSPSNFWVKTDSADHVTQILREKLDNDDLRKMDNPHVGTPAIVLHNNNIYRCNIIRKFDGTDDLPDKYFVQDIDSTLAFVVAGDALYELVEELSHIYPSCYNCCLSGIEDCVLPAELQNIFASLLSTNSLKITVNTIKKYIPMCCIVELKVVNGNRMELDVNAWVKNKVLPAVKESHSLSLDVMDPFANEKFIKRLSVDDTQLLPTVVNTKQNLKDFETPKVEMDAKLKDVIREFDEYTIFSEKSQCIAKSNRDELLQLFLDRESSDGSKEGRCKGVEELERIDMTNRGNKERSSIVKKESKLLEYPRKVVQPMNNVKMEDVLLEFDEFVPCSVKIENVAKNNSKELLQLFTKPESTTDLNREDKELEKFVGKNYMSQGNHELEENEIKQEEEEYLDLSEDEMEKEVQGHYELLEDHNMEQEEREHDELFVVNEMKEDDQEYEFITENEVNLGMKERIHSVKLEELNEEQKDTGKQQVLVISEIPEGVQDNSEQFSLEGIDQPDDCANQIENENEGDDHFGDWNPMEEDHKEAFDAVDDNACVAVSGYKQSFDDTICRTYSIKGHCRRGIFCNRRHVTKQEYDASSNNEQIQVYMDAFYVLKLPHRNTRARFYVNRVISPFEFYGFFVNEDEIDGSATNYCLNVVKVHMNRRETVLKYKKMRVMPLPGELIIVNIDSTWYRARFKPGATTHLHLMVFLVDYGTESIVHIDNCRFMVKECLQYPLQAVECAIANAADGDMKNGSKLMKQFEKRICYINVVERNPMSRKLYVSLSHDGVDVGEELIKNCSFKYLDPQSYFYNANIIPG